MSDNDAIINEFLTESYENLDQLDRDLIELEQNPEETDILSGIFRTIHTIKGTCGFLAFSKLESIAHVGENLLSKLRDGELPLTAGRTSALLAMVDAIRQILSCIENDKNEGDVDYSLLVETLTWMLEPDKEEGDASATVPAARKEGSAATQESLFDRIGGNVAVEKVVDVFYGKVMSDVRINRFFDGVPMDRQKEKMRLFLTFAFGGATGYDGKSLESAHAPLVKDGLDDSHFDAVMENLGATLKELSVPDGMIQEAASIAESVRNAVLNKDKAPAVETAPVAQAAPPAEERRGENTDKEASYLSKNTNRRDTERRKDGVSVADSSIRVDVTLLDTLMNLVGELVLARNQILQFSNTNQDAAFTATSQHLNLVTTELQEGVMKTRMQPVGNIWDKFPRVVRDLSMACGKKIRLEMEGKDTELDKTLIEAIKDPLTHIVRNSVDHGIEMPEVRIAAGKPEEGVLLLRAFHEGGQVNIEISDDGGGIDPEKIKRKAIEKNVITEEQAAKMSDREAVNMVFAAGFSTAEKVTNVSGRGVGMDVVKTNIEKIGGTVEIQSRPGEGTTLKVKIPLTLAIIPALTVTCGTDRYAIPQVNLLELVRLDAEQVKTRIERIQGTPVYRLRGRLLPLVYLSQELQTDCGSNGESDDESTVNIVVLQADNRQFGLVVEGIRDTEEIVVKPLGKQLSNISAFSGATIMGDGKVALILDVLGLAQKARVVTEGQGDRALTEKTEKQKAADNHQTLLILSVGGGKRMAIPLSEVARLEEFKSDAVEFSGEREVVQYRNEIMPLVHLCEALGISDRKKDVHSLHAVVYSKNNKSVGLVVDHILDIVEEDITVKRASARKGILGTVVVQKRVTDLIDVESIVLEADPSFNETETALLTSGGA
ncbi:MAG: chemotaxis protein CheA [Nitrospinae bacterium]|nr:chemotaxis protein CheA [Nitrospinota bacterium]